MLKLSKQQLKQIGDLRSSHILISPEDERRIRAIEKLSSGWRVKDVSKLTGFSTRKIYYIRTRFLEGGLDSILRSTSLPEKTLMKSVKLSRRSFLGGVLFAGGLGLAGKAGLAQALHYNIATSAEELVFNFLMARQTQLQHSYNNLESFFCCYRPDHVQTTL